MHKNIFKKKSGNQIIAILLIYSTFVFWSFLLVLTKVQSNQTQRCIIPLNKACKNQWERNGLVKAFPVTLYPTDLLAGTGAVVKITAV